MSDVMDKLEETYGDLGLDNIKYRTPEDYTALEHDANAKIEEQYNNPVYVGSIISRREVFKDLCLYATIHFPDPTTNGFTPQQVEGYIKCSTLSELATVAHSLSVGKTLIIDRETLEILEVRTC
ncbi:hypothetical protein [Clostridium sp.]|uniref:hypothetical protein n=1 Tax=Clostridium sp. TaxID=1506 RepID=UPI0028406CF1|nr:hypothetical protein [Clostridium sp.]MDR3597069.1 hypothetical protein [Clostridium sp.]